MQKRNGNKARGNHTTLTELGARVYDIVKLVDGVKGVAPGRLVLNARVTTTQRVRVADFVSDMNN